MGGVNHVEAAWGTLILSPSAPWLLPVAADWLFDHYSPVEACDAVRAGVYSPSPINPKGFGESYGYGDGSGDGSGSG